MRHVLGGAGIVDQRVEPSPGRGGGDDLPAILVARDVALHHHDFGAGAAAEIGGRFGFLLAGGIIDDDARAALGQNGRGRSPQAGRRTRYDRAQTILRHPHFLLLLLIVSSRPLCRAIYHIARQSACKSAKLRCAELSFADAFMPPRRRPCGQRLSWRWLFPIIERKKRPHPMPGGTPGRDGANQNRGTLWRRARTLLPRPRRRFSPISPTPRPSTATRRALESAALAGADRSRPAAVMGAGRLRRLGREPRRRF